MHSLLVNYRHLPAQVHWKWTRNFHDTAECGIGLLQQTITWYKIHHTGGHAHFYSCTGTLKQRPVKLDWLSSLYCNVWTCVGIIMTCTPAWRILYHVIVCCIRPIKIWSLLVDSCRWIPIIHDLAWMSAALTYNYPLACNAANFGWICTVQELSILQNHCLSVAKCGTHPRLLVAQFWLLRTGN